MLKRTYEGSSIIRNDVVLVFDGIVEVWANENGQHGIVGQFDKGKDAATFVYNNFSLINSH